MLDRVNVDPGSILSGKRKRSPSSTRPYRGQSFIVNINNLNDIIQNAYKILRQFENRVSSFPWTQIMELQHSASKQI